MYKRIGLASLLLLAAAPGWGYNLSAFYDGQASTLLEADGRQTVTVRLERELDGTGLPTDPPGTCIIDATVQAGPFGSPTANDATPDVDYTPVSSQVIRLALFGDQLGLQTTFDVPVIDDAEPEQTEIFWGQVVAVTPIDCDPGSQFNLLPASTIPILDDDQPTGSGEVEFVGSPYSVPENAGVATIVVNRIDGGSGALTYSYFLEGISAVPDQDFTDVSGGTLQWGDGETGTRSFDIPLIDNQLIDGDREVQIFVQNVDNDGQFLVGSLTITNEDVPAELAFEVTEITVREDAGLVEARVIRTASSTGDVTVGYSFAAGTATQGEDYVGDPDTLSWPDGDSSPRTITAQINPGSVAAGGEDFFIDLVETTGPATVGANSRVRVLIQPLNAGALEFAGTPLSVAENAGTATIVVNRIGGSDGELTADYALSGGTATAGVDYNAVSGTLVWADGDAQPKSFGIPILDNTALDGDRTVNVALTPGVDGADPIVETLAIVDDDQPSAIGFTVTDLTVDEDAGTVTATVARSAGAPGTVTVEYSTADGTATASEDYTALAGTLTWTDADFADKQIQIEILAGQLAGSAEDFTIVLANVSGPATLAQAAVATVSIGPGAATRDISGIESLTPNQRQLATWFDETCPRLEASEGLNADEQDLRDICGVIRSVELGDDELKDALDAINPEELFAAGTSALRLTVAQHGNLSQRLNALRNGARGVDLSGLNLEIDGQLIAGDALQAFVDGLIGGGASADEPTWGRWGAFLNGRISSGDKDETVNEAGFDYDLQGLTLGVDYRIRDNLIAGIAGGLGTVESDYQGNAGGLDIDSWNASAFLTYFREETFYADAMVTYGENDYDSTRNILFDAGALGLVDRTARGSTDGTQFSAGIGLGWDFGQGAWTYGPHAGVYHYRVEVDGFAETGAGGLDLAIGDQEVTSLTGNAGGHLSYAVLTDWGVLVPNARIDWVREFEDGAESLTYGFVNDPFVADPQDPSPKITLRSDRPDTSYFIMAAGVSAQFIQGISGFVNYQTYSGYGDFTISEWNFGLRWEKTY